MKYVVQGITGNEGQHKDPIIVVDTPNEAADLARALGKVVRRMMIRAELFKHKASQYSQEKIVQRYIKYMYKIDVRVDCNGIDFMYQRAHTMEELTKRIKDAKAR